jgi:hypothetical protein
VAVCLLFAGVIVAGGLVWRGEAGGLDTEVVKEGREGC